MLGSGAREMSAVYDFQNTARYRAACEQGATFRRVIQIQDNARAPVNLSGYSARMQVRAKASAASPLIEFTSANGRIEMNGPQGKMILKLAASETDTIEPGVYVYDLEIANGLGDVQRILEGRFVVTANVTR